MDRAILVTDFRYMEQAASQAPGFQITRHEAGPIDAVVELLGEIGLSRVGFEASHLTFKEYQDLNQKASGVELVPVSGMVERLRACKDEGELARIEEAVTLADRAFTHVFDLIRPGTTEKTLALELEFFMRREGAEKAAFEFIVASGARGSLPHGVATDRRLEAGDMVTLDFGCVLNGYNSDITRTVVLGEPNSRQQGIYDLVLKAQLAGIEAVRAGKKANEVDEACRGVIREAGFGDYFGHSTGHGVGLAIHEEPSVSSRNEAVLEPGMVITIEPGVYLPGWGGVRIEDVVVVTDEGHRVLTGSPKELMVCGRVR